MNRARVNRRGLLAASLALFVLSSSGHAAEQTGPQPELPRQRLVIVSANGTRHEFSVEMALTPDQQETGLMFRTVVPADGGMLFDWGQDQQSQMWMKNTVSSLDMLFVAADGTVRHIAERTTPRSLAVIDGGVVRATLEVAAGTAERLDIRVGDRVLSRIFNNLP